MLGNFHEELAFFAAVGNFISESRIEYILKEANILTKRSMLALQRENFSIDAVVSFFAIVQKKICYLSWQYR